MKLVKASILPLIISLVFIAGFYLGSFNSNEANTSTHLFSYAHKTNKINQILDYIEQEYVDTLDRTQLMDETIEFMLQKLDPHSYYISAQELQAMSEPLEGSFEGIGIQFSIQKDTVVVIDPISGGPSEKVGLLAGDRIVKVDTQIVAGNGVTNSQVMRLLKGPGGTEVKVGIKRKHEPSLLNFTITRDQIPIHSVDIGYMINETTGYIKVSRFAKTTHEEFKATSTKLLEQGMKNLILDLRSNGGGVMDGAIKIADEFLSEGKLIVYTQGRARAKTEHFATQKGNLENIELAVLINEGSASASEILAGAVQDNDRGTVYGKRSFGKGLVQEQTPWPDGSATRLTIARYYTPTGRCIQRPYDHGSEAYHKASMDRYRMDEENDSINAKQDTVPFVTPGGKTVYGGGGITPDIEVSTDTTGASLYLTHLYYNGVFYQFAFEYADEHRDEIKYQSVNEFMAGFTVKGTVENEFYEFAKSKGLPKSESGIKRSRELILYRIKAGIARNLYGNKGFYPIVNQHDNVVKRALEDLTLSI
jgi:carboxyl-terminal processing protease